MRRILKWDVLINDEITEIGDGTVVLVDCQFESASIQIWTDDRGSGLRRKVAVFGTGHSVPYDAVHLGSVAAPNRLVWHVFEVSR